MDIEGSKGDRKALHASCPTTKGMKWTATKWIHNKAYMGASCVVLYLLQTPTTLPAPPALSFPFLHNKLVRIHALPLFLAIPPCHPSIVQS